MGTIAVTIHVLVCIVLMLAILMQSGKGGGLSSSFGGGGGAGGGMAGQMFGGRGAGTFLSKVTSVTAALYMVMVIVLNLIPASSQAPSSLIREEALKNQQASPAQGLPTVPGQAQPVTPISPSSGQPAAPATGQPEQGQNTEDAQTPSTPQ